MLSNGKGGTVFFLLYFKENTTMNEAENTLTLPKEVSNEVFFKEEARRIREAFNNKSNELDLEYLRHQLKCMKSLATSLELPWDRFIPILFRSLTLYMQQPDININKRKMVQLTAQLIDCITYLSQSGREINALAVYFDHQIDDLDNLLAKNEEQQGNSVIVES